MYHELRLSSTPFSEPILHAAVPLDQEPQHSWFLVSQLHNQDCQLSGSDIPDMTIASNLFASPSHLPAWYRSYLHLSSFQNLSAFPMSDLAITSISLLPSRFLLTVISFSIPYPRFEVFTVPHVFRVESVWSPSCPRTVLGLNSD